MLWGLECFTHTFMHIYLAYGHYRYSKCIFIFLAQLTYSLHVEASLMMNKYYKVLVNYQHSLYSRWLHISNQHFVPFQSQVFLSLHWSNWMLKSMSDGSVEWLWGHLSGEAMIEWNVKAEEGTREAEMRNEAMNAGSRNEAMLWWQNQKRLAQNARFCAQGFLGRVRCFHILYCYLRCCGE